MLKGKGFLAMIGLAVLSYALIGVGQDPPVLSGGFGAAGSTAVVVFHVAEEATHAWVLTAEGVRVSYRIEISRSELRERVTAFLDLVGTIPRPGWEMVQRFLCLEQGRDLYDLLLAPGEAHLQGFQNVVIVPSDVLWYLPFAALYRCPGCEGRDLLEGQFWVADQALSLASSLEMALGTLGPVAEAGLRSALVVAWEPYGTMLAQDEAAAVASSFRDSTVLLGTEATGSRVKDLLGERRYDVLHFTWGVLELDRTDPLLSGIRLLESATDDGVLRVREVLDLRVRTRLLVLSGGLAGTPDLSANALPLALDAFRASGIASVVFALGSVSDLATAWLMPAMYEGLRDGLSRAEALRQAQLKLLQDEAGLFRYPWHWALFVLHGEWGGMKVSQLPGTDKLDYTLARLLTEWKSRPHPPDEVPPVVSVLVTLERPATGADLEAFGNLSSELELVGSFGVFVQVRIPLPLLEALIALPQVRSISVPPETIHN